MEKFKDKYSINDYITDRTIKLTEMYIKHVFESEDSKNIDMFSEDVPINDISENLNRLKHQLSILKRLKINNFPCLKTDDEQIVPIDIFQILQIDKYYPYGIDEYYRNIFIDDYLYYMLSNTDVNKNQNFIIISFETIKPSLKKLVNSFLEIRFASILDKKIKNDIDSSFQSKDKHTNTTSSSYLKVKVNTINHGLEISASPAYFISWKKFGSPTSPVTGFLLPATYKFAASGVNLPNFTIDPIPVDIPPNFDINISTF